MKRFAAVPLIVATVLAFGGCSSQKILSDAATLSGGDPHKGASALQRYGCISCHTIPGIPGADGLVGPPLNRIASRVYLAGVLPNTPENMVRWIRNPQSVDQLTVMPNTGLTEADARDIVGYLYTLR